MRRWSWVALWVLSCSPGGLELIVDLKTDLVAGVEFVQVRVELDDGERTEERDARGDATFDEGQRVAEFDDLRPNPARTVYVALLDEEGGVVARRRVVVQHTVSRAVTVLITRDCRGVDCSEEQSCYGGRCVDRACVTGTESSCPAPECVAAGDCPAMSMCAPARCEGAVCVYVSSGGCESEEYCDPEMGCRPLPTTVDAGTVDAGTVDDDLTIEVAHANTLVAPALVWLRATGHAGLASFAHSGPIYDGAHHEYHHEWVIDGEPLPPWTKVENLPAPMNNPNRAYGREVAFVLSTAGSYTVSLTVRDRLGNIARARTGTLTVMSPEDYYAEDERIYVDPEGLWEGVPNRATKVRTVGEAELACPTVASGSKPPWVLLRGGVRHDLDLAADPVGRRGSWFIQSSATVGYVSSYGTGRARLVPSTAAGLNHSRAMIEVWMKALAEGEHLTITGIDFEGNYDPTTERGAGGNDHCIALVNSSIQGAFVTVYDVDAYNVNQFFRGGATGTATTSHHAVVNCDLPNGWRTHASFNGFGDPGVAVGKVAFLGNRFRQHPDALHGGDREDGLVNTHGPITISRAEYAYLAQNDIFSRTGWYPARRDRGREDQPCLHLFTAPADGMAAHVERNVFEGGSQTVRARDPNLEVRGPANVVFENNILVASAKNFGPQLQVAYAGWTVRNNLVLYPDTPRHGPNWGRSSLELLVAAGQTEESLGSPFVVYNNTVLNLVSAANDRGRAVAFSEFSPEFLRVVEVNNIHHVPDGTTAVTGQAPIDLTTTLAGFRPRFRGTRYGYDLIHFTPSADVGPGESFLVPYSATHRRLQDGTYVDGDMTPTDQDYWLDIAATDTRHALYQSATSQRLWAELGDIEVQFTAAGIEVRNMTSDVVLAGGEEIRLHLDRTSRIPPMDTSFASPPTVPVPVPAPGSPAYRGATGGDVALDDLYRLLRTAPASMGAVEP